MPKPLNTILAQIAEKKPPRAILIGGSSDYLSQRAFRDIRDAIVAANPNMAMESFEPAASEMTRSTFITRSAVELPRRINRTLSHRGADPEGYYERGPEWICDDLKPQRQLARAG